MAMTSDAGRRDLLSVRRSLRRLALVSCCEIYPGSREYRRHANLFMPLQVRLGQDVESLESVTWRPGLEANGFFLILGASGSGKTETLKAVGRHILEHGIPVLVLDFHGDVRVPGLSSVLMSSGTDSWAGVNPLEIDSHRAHEVGLRDQYEAVVDIISRTIRLGGQQRSVLLEAVAEAYRCAGMREDAPATWHQPPPTLDWVLSILQHWAEAPERTSQRASIRSCISAVQGAFGHPVFSRSHHLVMDDILTMGMRVDLSKAPVGIRTLVADTLLRKVFRAVALQGETTGEASDLDRFRLFIVIDEVKILSTLKGDVDDPRLILNLLATEARKFGIGLILASQMSSHFGAEVRGNAATWLVLKPMDMEQARRNGREIGVMPEQLMELRGHGEGFLRWQGDKVRRVQVHRLSPVTASDAREE